MHHLFVYFFSPRSEPEEVFASREKVQKEVEATLAESASLVCEVAQPETEVLWFRQGKLLTSSRKFRIESEGKTRRLTVQQVEQVDAGEYTCEAMGQKLTFKVVVTGTRDFFLYCLLGRLPENTLKY